MLFEDFNYKMYNKYILKDPTKSSTGYSDEDEDFTVNEYAITNKLQGKGNANKAGLRAAFLHYSDLDNYEH